jgi:RNA recognition motif-containing protein
MNNSWRTTQGSLSPEMRAKSYKPGIKVGAPFALDYNDDPATRTVATGFRVGGPKEARLHRVALLRSDSEVDHLFSVRVENLGPKATPEKLKEKFSQWGEVGNIYLPKNLSTGKLKGFAYVRYVRKEDADRALEECKDVVIEKKKGPVKVAPPLKQNTFFSGHTGSAGITGFVEERPVPEKTAFQQVISLDDCMARNGAPWVSKHELLRLEPHAPLETHDCWSLKISPLERNLNVQHIWDTFEPYGTIKNVYCPKVLLKDQWCSDPNEGFAFIRFEERGNAEDAKKAMEGKEFYGNILEIELLPPKYWPREPTRRYH